MTAEFTNPRTRYTPEQPKMPTLDAVDGEKVQRKKSTWINLALGLAWMTPVGFFLTRGMDMMPKLESITVLAPHINTLTGILTLLCAVSVLSMAYIFRRAFRGMSPISLAIGMGAGFLLGCGPAEIMTHLNL